MFAPVPIPPSLSGEHRWLRWMLDQKGGIGTGEDPRPPAQQAAKKPPSHPCCPPDWAVRAGMLCAP